MFLRGFREVNELSSSPPPLAAGAVQRATQFLTALHAPPRRKMTSRTILLLALLATPSRASECPAKKCANWCKSELKENHCRVQPCCGCKMCDLYATQVE